MKHKWKLLLTKYNELVALVDKQNLKVQIHALGDKSSIRSIISQIKDKLFGSYGSNGDKKSVFNFGIELDKYGSLSFRFYKI